MVMGLYFFTRCGDIIFVAVNKYIVGIDGLLQDCSISSALTMEILPSCTESSIYILAKNQYKQSIKDT